MKIISWNLSFCKKIEPKMEYLISLLSGCDFIVVLQEVTELAYKVILLSFPHCNIEYSLKYRKPGKYDTQARKLGVTIITSKNVEIKSAKVLDRTPFPDRTLIAHCCWNNISFSVMGAHSITGCDYKKAKSVQFYSFSEAIDVYKPWIACFDANEPQEDNINVNDMVFFDNKDNGNGARTFFTTMVENNLSEAYSLSPKANATDLPFSHCLKTIKKRYDFIFLNRYEFILNDIVYDYDNSINSGSDHAAVIADIDLKHNH